MAENAKEKSGGMLKDHNFGISPYLYVREG